MIEVVQRGQSAVRQNFRHCPSLDHDLFLGDYINFVLITFKLLIFDNFRVIILTRRVANKRRFIIVQYILFSG